jgi:hypothetical protein
MAKASETLQLLRDEWVNECYGGAPTDNEVSRQAVEIVAQMFDRTLDKAIYWAKRAEESEAGLKS